MSLSVNTNIASLQAQNYLRANSDMQQRTIGRVTSGLRILSSGDDAAGLAIANGFRSDQAVLTQGIRNANDGLSQLQIIDGGLNNISRLLDRARTLATQSASGTFTGNRAVLNSEFQSVLTEIDRQAQAIGLNTGGDFARNLSVFVGGGRASGGSNAITNGSVSVDLSTSTVDSRSLGLAGVQAAGVSGTDISTASSTSVASILTNSVNTQSQTISGSTVFTFRGPGFSDDSRVNVSVNLAGVSSTQNLVTALNSAIDAAGNQGSQQATAFRNAGIRAVVVQDRNADGTVRERLGFTSSTSAFQVGAGDRTANALLGNFSEGSTGAAVTSAFVGGANAAAAGASGATASNIIVRFQGGGLSSPIDLRLAVTGGTTTTQAVLADLSSQVANNAALQAAGITVANATSGERLAFTDANGGSFEVLTAGDTTNILGLGTFALASSGATTMDYTSITSAGAYGADGSIRLELSINGSSTLIDTGTVAFTGGGAAARRASAVANLNAFFGSNASAQAAGLRAVDDGSQVRIESTNGTAFRVNTRAAGTLADLNFSGGATAAAITSNLGSAIRSTAQTAYTAVTGDTLQINVNGVTRDVAISNGDALATIVTALNTAIGADGSAATVNGRTVINAAANTKIEIASGSTAVLNALGLRVGDTNIAVRSTFNSGGAYETALGDGKDVFNYTQFRNGGDSQTLNIVAQDATGSQRSIAITLRNDSIARNARSLDEALRTINNALQSSGDPTLRQMVAVRETTADGTQQGIRFLSNVQNFRVTMGTVAGSTAAAEVGIFDGTTGSSTLGQGTITSATQAAGGTQLDINSQANAQAAVTSLATAIAKLGDSQAVVGRGQNQFNYAVNLASSQLTNLAASESRIRDADLAAEAANLTKAQITLQAGVAALAQANSAPQAVLALLRG